MKRHKCGCETVEVKSAACTHVTPEVLRNARVASHYLHTVLVRRTGGDPAPSLAGGADDAFRKISCSVCAASDCPDTIDGGERPRFFACLQCFFIGCHHRGHLEQHLDWSGHQLALDLELRKVYCHACKDYVYNSEIDRQIESGRRQVMHQHRRPKQKMEQNLATVKIPPLSALKEHAFARSSNAQILGLRGMVNMGNTCFMSSVLQALVHNPFLRTAFLSDCEWSPTKTIVAHSPRAGDTRATPPLRMDMARLFTEMYSGATAPHAPYYLLHSVWKHSAYLSGYQQQDAHEFLIFILNQLHAQMQVNVPDESKVKAEPGTIAAGAAPTKPTIVLKTPASLSESIISRVFRGKLRSDVTCCGCRAVSTTYDPFFDLPLDLAGRTAQTQPVTNASQDGSEKASAPTDPAAGDAASAGVDTASAPPSTPRTPRGPGSTMTISDCLHSFTRTEELDSDDQWVCSACKSANKRTKRLSIATLPVILVLQVKRFAKTMVQSAKGNGQQVVSRKLEQHIKFPTAGLDLRPHTSAELLSRKQDQEASTSNDASISAGKKPRTARVSAMLQPTYTLFSVIVHFGSLEQGHYITYVKGHASEQWYKIDDANITRVTRAEVLAAEA